MTLGAEDVAAGKMFAAAPNADPSIDSDNPPHRWPVKLSLLALSAVLMSASFAPFGQFYAAWICLVPWLLAISASRSAPSAAGWGWVGGCIFFLTNLSYLLLVTIPGALSLPLYLAIYWAAAAVIIKRARLLEVSGACPLCVLRNAAAIASIWVAAEYLRGSLLTGLPWLFLGYSQSPLLVLCQISDITGVYGVSFIVALVNALAAMTILHRSRRKSILPAWAAAALLVLVCALYGWMRLSQRAPLTPGPIVLVVQPNEAHFRDKGALEKQRESVTFHFQQTTLALASARPDLIVWSETTMPALNREVWEELGNSPVGRFSEQVHRALSDFARSHATSMIVGGYYVDYSVRDGKRVASGMRNSAFYYDRSGSQSARYDKLHLVPFGEFIPARSWAWLYPIFLWLSPHSAEYAVTPGPPDALTLFNIERGSNGASRFVSPICFDDIDPALIARMVRGAAGVKRADFIVNLTNDGWFRWNEQPQHLQHALFRSIENRVPTARAVNTGVSGFIDSCGRVGKTVPVRTTGAAVAELKIDHRYAFYTRFGDIFALACLLTSIIVAISSLRRPACAA